MFRRRAATSTAQSVIIFIVISVVTHGAQIKEDIIKFVLCTHELHLGLGREEVRIKEGRECRQERQRESYKVFFILFVTTPPSNLYTGVPS